MTPAVVPITMRGCWDGSSQRNTSSSCDTGSDTQPAVGPPLPTCRKIALPRTGVRALLYAITAPYECAGTLYMGSGSTPAFWLVVSTHSLFKALPGSSSHTIALLVTTRKAKSTPGSGCTPKKKSNPYAPGNCRYAVADGPPQWSAHAYGQAIDVNTVENPYLQGDAVQPATGSVYLDRADVRPGMAVDGGVLVAAFASVGWQWGGRWAGTPDYQHFSKTGG